MPRLFVLVFAAVTLLAVAPTAIAGPSAESDSTVAGTNIHQEINFLNPEIHYWFRARNPAGAPVFCVTLRLERKGAGGWHGIGMNSRRGVKHCCEPPDEECFPTETKGGWDLFLYPRGKLVRKVKRGRLRIHGFTNLGPSLTLRLARPRA